MTDRIHALTVILEQDMRDDDVKVMINAIRLLRNVHSVKTHVTSVEAVTMYERAKTEFYMKIRDIFYPKG